MFFDFIKFEEIISDQRIFVSDRTTNMQFSTMQNAMYGALVTIQLHAKCNTLLTEKSQAIKFFLIIFVANLTRSLLSF